MKIIILIVLCLFTFGVVHADEMKTVVYPVVFGDIDALETYARTVVADDGHVVQDGKGNRLIVVTTPDKHAQLDQVLGQSDAQTANVRIEVQFREQGVVRETGAGLHGDGAIVIGPGGVDHEFMLRPDLRHTVTESSVDTRQILMVASGREGVLRVGEQVPYIDWLMEYGWHGGYVTSRVQWQQVGSFLVVTPTVLADGETIHIRLTPELRGLVDGSPYRTRFAGLATDVMVRDGQTVAIGGLSQDQDFYRRFLIGVDRSGVRRSLDIDVTPRLVPSGPAR